MASRTAKNSNIGRRNAQNPHKHWGFGRWTYSSYALLLLLLFLHRSSDRVVRGAVHARPDSSHQGTCGCTTNVADRPSGVTEKRPLGDFTTRPAPSKRVSDAAKASPDTSRCDDLICRSRRESSPCRERQRTMRALPRLMATSPNSSMNSRSSTVRSFREDG